MKTTHKNLLEIAKAGGAVAASDWTRGSGKFVSRRPTPDGAVEVEIPNRKIYPTLFEFSLKKLSPRSRRVVKKLASSRPLVKIVLVISDWKLAGQLLKDDKKTREALEKDRAEKIAAQEKSDAELKARDAEVLAGIGGDFAKWQAGGFPHPAPAGIVALKIQSGQSWTAFQNSISITY